MPEERHLEEFDVARKPFQIKIDDIAIEGLTKADNVQKLQKKAEAHAYC